MRKILFIISFPALMLTPLMSVKAASSSEVIKEAAVAVSPEPAVGSLQEAMKEFKNLSKRERKARISEAKKAIKQFKAEKKAGTAPVASTLVQVIFAILIPPLGVYLHEGEINNKFWLDLLLTILFFIPGLIYALIVVLGTV